MKFDFYCDLSISLHSIYSGVFCQLYISHIDVHCRTENFSAICKLFFFPWSYLSYMEIFLRVSDLCATVLEPVQCLHSGHSAGREDMRREQECVKCFISCSVPGCN